MTSIPLLIERNAMRWHAMHIHAQKIPEFDKVAGMIFKNKDRYSVISDGTTQGNAKVPWWFIGVAHYREANCNFNCQLGQGDPLGEVSRHDPKGRGPFFNHADDPPGKDAFYRAALDALINCGPYAARWRDWTPGGTMTIWEEYNGLGYAAMGVPSAYVWSGSDQYVSGKYVADHVYRSGVVDVQEGCAPILARLMVIDPTISFMQ